MRPLLLPLLLVACGDKAPADTGPAGGSGDPDPCAEAAEGEIIDRVEPACAGFTHTCDPTGARVVVETVCEGGEPVAVDVPEDCERDVVAESGCVVHEGDVTLGGADDVAALSGVNAVLGRIVVNTDDTTGLESLAYVSGPIGMGVRPLTALSGLSGLVSAEGGISLLCVSGDDLSFWSGLEDVGGDIAIVGAGQLTSVSFPGLRTLRGELQVEPASDQACGGSTRTLDALLEIGPFAPELDHLGALYLRGTRQMEGLGALEQITGIDGDVVLLDNRALSECDIDAWLAGVAIGGATDLRNNADCQ